MFRPQSRPLPFMLACGLLLAAQGCAWMRGPRLVQVPQGFLQTERTDMYARLFPPMDRLQAKGRLVARSGIWPGKEYFDFLFFALGPERLRFKADRLPIGTVFDLIVNEGQMTVILPAAHAFFQGPVPAAGSPFGRRFGVEPGDLVPALQIGQYVAAGAFAYQPADDETTLLPRGETGAGGLAEIRLENLSGLPREAVWRMKAGDRRIEWRVRYLAFDWFTVTEGQPPRLLPSRVEIRSRRSRAILAIEVTKYLAPAAVDPDKVFKPAYRGEMKRYPLTALDELLGN